MASVKENSGYELIYECLERFGGEASPEDQAAIGNALGIENCADIDRDAAGRVDFCAAASYSSGSSNDRSKKPTDNNKLAAAEVLAILVQTSDENKKRVGELGGIDALLRAVAPFKGKDPATRASREVLENIFDGFAALDEETTTSEARGERGVGADADDDEEQAELQDVRDQVRGLRADPVPRRVRAVRGHPPKTRLAPWARIQKLRKSAGLEAVQEEEERAVSVVSSLFLHLAKAPRGTTGSAPSSWRTSTPSATDSPNSGPSTPTKAVDARLETRTDDIELTPDDLYVERLGGGAVHAGAAESDLRLRLRHGSRGDPSAVAAADGVTRGGRGRRRRSRGGCRGCDSGSRPRSVRNILETHAENIGGADGWGGGRG